MVENLGIYVLVGFFTLLSFFSVLAVFLQKGLYRHVFAALCLGALAVLLCIFFGSPSGSSPLVDLFFNSISREKSNLISLFAGALLGSFSGYSLLQSNESFPKKVLNCASLGCTLLAFLLIFIRQQYPNAIYGQAVDPRYFEIETVASLSREPNSICLGDSGEVYVSFESFVDGRENSGICKFRKDDAGGWSRVDSGLDGLFARTFGMAFKDGALYISRSGRLIQAEPERLNVLNTGVVTRCLDTDKDGRFDYFEDIVKDLPGLQIPDSQHSNNGILFGKDSSLYLAVGTPTNRTVHLNPVEGTILKCAPPNYSPEIFAPGFRNPFAMVMSQEGELFVTDNDTNKNRGDEVNLVVENHHYGHPYVLPGDPQGESNEFTQPIWIGGPASNLVGISYLGRDKLPLAYQDSLLVTDLPNNTIYQLKLEREGGKVLVKNSSLFARIPKPVGVVYDGKDSLFVISRRPDNKLYKITFKNL